MGQITLDQSHQVMAVLATNAAWEEIDFSASKLQDAIIRDPKGAGKLFTEFLKGIARFGVGDPIAFQAYIDNLFLRIVKLLLKRFGKKCFVDPPPPWFTEQNLARAAKFNLRPIFLPDEEIDKNRILRDWVKPGDWFYCQIENGTIAKDSAHLKRGWYLADFTCGVDYDKGIQVFPNDPLASIIAKLRQDGRIGQNDKTPLGSRFAILPKNEWSLVFEELAKELGVALSQIRLERAIEFNAIGSLYDKNRGRFNMWEWFDDAFEGSNRLSGGYRGNGGLAHVRGEWAGVPHSDISGRPLVCF